jgi:threonylcarbamoyladenosine tRNA methylthiotransferase MtaB
MKPIMTLPKTVAFHTFGCKVNQYETEELRGQLRLGGFRVVPMDTAADVYVLNSCSVTADADSSCRQMVRKLLREQPKSRVVVTGCYAERAPQELHDLSPNVEVFGNREKPLIAIALGVPTACVQEAARSGVVALAERTRVYLKVQDGCDAHCTYCIIPSVRPDLVCSEPGKILREAEQLLARGYKEIVLTGVRLGRYEWQEPHPCPLPQGEGGPPQAVGEAGRWDLARLVKALVELPGDFRVRLSSIEVTEISDSLIRLMRDNPKVCPHFHIPLQSGDNEILKRMGRWYTSDDYRSQVRKIKSQIPDAALSADVIVGFPGEGESQFENSARLLEEEGFSRLHVFRYSVRPGTPAERLPRQVDPRVKSARARTLVKLDGELRSRYARCFLDRPLRVLQESDGAGYTERYVRVRSASPAPEGSFQWVNPTQITPEAMLVEESAVAISGVSR